MNYLQKYREKNKANGIRKKRERKRERGRERESNFRKNGSWLIQVIVWGQKNKKKESLRETDARICVWRKKKEYMKQYKKIFQQCIETTKENNELKSLDVDAVKNLMNDKVESLSDAEIYPYDDDDS